MASSAFQGSTSADVPVVPTQRRYGWCVMVLACVIGCSLSQRLGACGPLFMAPMQLMPTEPPLHDARYDVSDTQARRLPGATSRPTMMQGVPLLHSRQASVSKVAIAGLFLFASLRNLRSHSRAHSQGTLRMRPWCPTFTALCAVNGENVNFDETNASNRQNRQLWLPRFISASALVILITLATSGPATADDGNAFAWFDGWVNINAQIIESIDNVIGSAGAAIVVYTLLIKAVTYPLNQASLRTTAVLQLVKPQIQEIEARFSEDTQKEEREDTLRRLFNSVEANPLNGCLPTIIQIPIFIGLFRAISSLASKDSHFKEPFLWIPSLAGPASSGQPSIDWLIRTRSTEQFEPIVGWDDATRYLVLPVLLVIIQLFIGQLTNATDDEGEVNTAAFLFPIFIGISTMVSPSAVGIYWLFNSLVTGAQMFAVKGQVENEFPEYAKIKNEMDMRASGAMGTVYKRKAKLDDEEAPAEKTAVQLSVDKLAPPKAVEKPKSRKLKRAEEKRRSKRMKKR